MKVAFGAFAFLLLAASGSFAAADEAEVAVPALDVPVLSDEEREALTKNQEEHQYQAEVTRLMDIIINSLYTQRDVFLRELISNAVDALEKARFLGIKNPAIKEFSEFEIRVAADPKANVLSICDTGVGMNKHELVNNLGTVAKSGTSNFLESLGQNNDVNLIGQFGVGFYSAFLVADRVTVVSKTATDDQYIWESSADAKYYVTKDPRGNTLKRGTCVLLHMKSDATEFFNQDKLRELVKRYSQFISFPIRLLVTRKVYEEVPDEEEEKKEDEDKDGDEKDGKDEEKVEVKDVSEKEEKKPKTKKLEKEVQEWEQLNEQKAIWLRPREEITQEEYTAFYKALTRDWSEPMTQIHFTAEGEVEFKALLFIPKVAPHDMIGQYFSKSTSVRLYVRRVLVADAFDDLIPKYLSFIRGVVDSDDLPLNVSREQLQQSKILKIISTKVTRKTLDSVRKMFLDSETEREKLQQELEEATEESVKTEIRRKIDDTPFMRFYNQYGRNLLLGCYEDDASKSRISKILLFRTLKHPDSPISLERYVKEMQEGQKSIYYAAGPSVQEIAQQPTLQVFRKKNFDVLYLVESMDEPCLQKLQSFDGKPLESVQKGTLHLEETDEEKKNFRRLKKHFQPLTSWMTKTLGDSRVFSVSLSKRLVDAPCAIVATDWGLSAQMERVLKAQTFAEKDIGFRTQKNMEVNPHHVLIQKLLEKVKQGEDAMTETDVALVKQLYETAMMASGFETDNRAQLANIIYKELAKEAGVAPEEPTVNELVLPADDNEPEEVADDSSSVNPQDLLKNLGLGLDEEQVKDEL